MRVRLASPAAAVIAVWCVAATGLVAGMGRVERRPQTASQAGPVRVRETLLARLDPDADLQTVAVDPLTIRRVSWVSSGKGSRRLVLDGVPGPVFDKVFSPSTACTADSRNLVWWWPGHQDCPSTFSPDGRRSGYVAKRGKWFMVTDGETYGPYDLVSGAVAFSPDGRRAMWEARVNGKRLIVLDGVVHGPYERFVLSPRAVFSPDSQRVAFPVYRREGDRTVARMIVDGVDGPPYRSVGRPHFSPDSRHLAYWAHAEGQRGLQLMIDGKQVTQTTKASPELLEVLDNVLSDSGLPFAPDGTHVAFVTERDGRLVPVVRGKEGPPCDWISPLRFSSDFSRAAYVIGRKRNPLSAFSAWVTLSPGPCSDYACRLVVDGIEQTEGPSPSGPPVILTPDGRHAPVYLSPDGRTVAYVTVGNIVVDGAAVSSHGEDAYAPAFSPDGTRVACVVRRDGRTYVKIGGAEGGAAEQIEPLVMRVSGRRTLLTFSPDGRHVVCLVRQGPLDMLAIDLGARSPGYDSIVGGMIAFETPAVVVFAARRGRDVLRVEVDLASVTKPPA